jgi:hypothetical protein
MVYTAFTLIKTGDKPPTGSPNMTDNRTPREKPQHPDSTGKGKKPYQKPAFRYERVFETLALSCGKIGSSAPNCQFSRKTS